MRAWEYDADGNVVKTWRGDTTTDATQSNSTDESEGTYAQKITMSTATRPVSTN